MGYNRERQRVPVVVLVVTGVSYVACGAISGTTVTQVSDICGTDKLHPYRILSLPRKGNFVGQRIDLFDLVLSYTICSVWLSLLATQRFKYLSLLCRRHGLTLEVQARLVVISGTDCQRRTKTTHMPIK